MKSLFRIWLNGLIFVSLSAVTFAAPLPPMKPVTVEGTIVEARWSPSMPHKGQPGFSGSLGNDRVEPAHFHIKLRDYRGVEAAEACRLNFLLGDTTAPQGAPEFLLLKLNHDDAEALKKGMRLRVVDYRVAGDEGGTWTRYTKLEIDQKPVVADPLATPDVRRWDFIILIDFSGFGFGRKLYLKRDGACILQKVDRFMHATRYEYRVPPEELKELEGLLVKHHFWQIKTHERKGYLDEGRPSIIVHLDNGQSREVEKWSADKHPDFDPIYERLRNLDRWANDNNKVFDGKHDLNWRPPGFDTEAHVPAKQRAK